jgi:uncharacterized protein (DUF488 family)
MRPLYTIGYEGFDLSVWLAMLLDHGVQVVVDVRAVPHSRRAPFSKSRLKESLGDAGIEYEHVGSLGSPAEHREALRCGLDPVSFSRIFNSLLDERTVALEQILVRVARQRVCLLCYEEDPYRCHRTLVAVRLSEMRPGLVKVVHLRRNPPI